MRKPLSRNRKAIPGFVAACLSLVGCWTACAGAALASLPGAQPLTLDGDLSAQMVAGIDQYLTQATESAIKERARFWRRDFSSAAAYDASVQTNRDRLSRILGVVDRRLPVPALETLSNSPPQAVPAETASYTVQAVRWPVLEGVQGEGLWFRPKNAPAARIIALPDADQDPEQIGGLAPGLTPERQYARRLAENGCEVIVPALVNRQDTWSGNPTLRRFTNQPHREWIYRQSYELGRHIIGYEVQKVLAAIDFFAAESAPGPSRPKIGIAGYGEGGLIALYTAALDRRCEAVLVSGYFDSRQRLWEEPIYRNVFGLLREFGDAEIATLIAPRRLVVEYSPTPAVAGPPSPRQDRSGAAPGKLSTPDYSSVEAECDRAGTLLKPKGKKPLDTIELICGNEGMATGPGSDRALTALLNALGLPTEALTAPGALSATNQTPDAERQHRQITELEAFTQEILRQSQQTRTQYFWQPLESQTLSNWPAAIAPFRKAFWEDTLGRLPSTALPLNPRARQLADGPKWTGCEVVLDVLPGVYAWGYLLVPRDLKPDEKRPVVVCQHGLEGLPSDVINEDPNSQAYGYYKAFAARLAERGFVVFAPHNPYRGGDRFRQLQRKANPLGLSLFSFIVAQHSRALEWLAQLPFVDAGRIGFYGLSYGGKTAMRVPAVCERYALSICSGDFNEWVYKNAATDFRGSYMFTLEYEMPEWNLGSTFNYAEMAALIAPRPFMVERGHHDGVGTDEWVSYEYAKVRRLYDQLGIPDRTAIDFFNGGHTIHGQATFEFLQKHLGPTPSSPND